MHHKQVVMRVWASDQHSKKNLDSAFSLHHTWSVEIKMEKGASARKNFVSGLRDFTACPARKKSVRKATKRVSKPKTINL